jgi:hypothetical protein
MALLLFREVTAMDAQGSDGPNRASADGQNGQQDQNIVWGTSKAGQHSTVPKAVTAPAPARRPDAGLTQDGQLVEAGYGHGG